MVIHFQTLVCVDFKQVSPGVRNARARINQIVIFAPGSLTSLVNAAKIPLEADVPRGGNGNHLTSYICWLKADSWEIQELRLRFQTIH